MISFFIRILFGRMRDSFICMTIVFQSVLDKRPVWRIIASTKKKGKTKTIYIFSLEWPRIQDFESIQLELINFRLNLVLIDCISSKQKSVKIVWFFTKRHLTNRFFFSKHFLFKPLISLSLMSKENPRIVVQKTFVSCCERKQFVKDHEWSVGTLSRAQNRSVYGALSCSIC